jgi:hypothetical protein
MQVDPDGLELELLLQLESNSGSAGHTIVAFALTRSL